MTKKIYQLLVLLLVSSFLISCHKKPSVTGSYILQTHIEPSYNGCCSFTEIIKLDDNSKFFYYNKDDQGDYEIVEVGEGTYKNEKNIISFNFRKPTKLDFAKTKLLVQEKNNKIEALVSQDKSAKRFVKIDFQKLDSLTVNRTEHTDDWRYEKISIKSDKTLHYSATNAPTNTIPMNITKIVKLSDEQYQEIINYLNNKPLFSNANNNQDDKLSTSFELRFLDNSFHIYEQQKVDKALTDFLFAKAYIWMQEKPSKSK